jgi:flagellar biosynthesis protein FlhF
VNIKTYQAYSMAQALAAVKRDLGIDAVILSTRTFRRGGFLGFGRRTVVEVTATTAAESRRANSRRERTRLAPANSRAARAAYGGTATTATAEVAETDDRTRTQRLALALQEQHDRRREAEPLSTESVSAAERAVEASVPAPPRPPAPEPAPVAHTQESRPEPTATSRNESVDRPRRFVLLEPSDSAPAPGATKNGSRRLPPSLLPHEQPAPAGRETADRMQDELAAIRDMVGQVLSRQHVGAGPAVPSMPRLLFDMYRKLVEQDLSEELADQIINAVRDDLHGDQLEDAQAIDAAIRQKVAELVPVAETPVPSRSPDRRPLTIALIGPTGVGKTTTLAKLAASFKLRHNRRVGLITCDTYRIAAVEQLRTYAGIIGVPLEVALPPAEMTRCCHGLRDLDVILIDTAGRSQNDTGKLEELKTFLAAAEPHEVHLVLSSTAAEKVLMREAEAFAEVRTDKIVLTKLDEAVSFGMLINVMQVVGKKLSFVTTGQEVPDHIEIGQPDRIAQLVVDGAFTA